MAVREALYFQIRAACQRYVAQFLPPAKGDFIFKGHRLTRNEAGQPLWRKYGGVVNQQHVWNQPVAEHPDLTKRFHPTEHYWRWTDDDQDNPDDNDNLGNVGVEVYKEYIAM